jgi:hypothetical protein
LRDHGLEAQNVREGGLYVPKLWVGGSFVVLAGCAAAPRTPLPAHLLWQDQAFDYDAALVSIGKPDLFQLDAGLLSKLHDPRIQNSSAQYRLNHLVSLLFEPRTKDFSYSKNHTTIAAETWRRKSGECLSLTVLSYSWRNGHAGQMQEVRVPVIFDRRGNVGFLNRHVNLLISGKSDGGCMSGWIDAIR